MIGGKQKNVSESKKVETILQRMNAIQVHFEGVKRRQRLFCE